MQLVGCIDPPCGTLPMEEEEGRLLIFSTSPGCSPHTEVSLLTPVSVDPSAQVSLTLWVRSVWSNDGGEWWNSPTQVLELCPAAAFQLKKGFEIFAVGGRLKGRSQPTRSLGWESCSPS